MGDLDYEIKQLLNDENFIPYTGKGRKEKIEYVPIYEKIRRGEIPFSVEVKGKGAVRNRLYVSIKLFLKNKGFDDKYVVVTRKINDEKSILQVQNKEK